MLHHSKQYLTKQWNAGISTLPSSIREVLQLHWHNILPVLVCPTFHTLFGSRIVVSAWYSFTMPVVFSASPFIGFQSANLFHDHNCIQFTGDSQTYKQLWHIFLYSIQSINIFSDISPGICLLTKISKGSRCSQNCNGSSVPHCSNIEDWELKTIPKNLFLWKLSSTNPLIVSA